MRNLLVATFAAVAALTIVTCATPPLEGIDAPGAMLDVPGLRLDATPDAAADVIDATCDIEVRNWVDYGGGRYQRITTWFAEAPLAGPASSVSGVDVSLCDFENFGAGAAPACPDGATCTIDPAGSRPTCRFFSGADLVEGRLRVSCGSRNEYQLATPAAAPSDNGERARVVRFFVR